MSRLTDEIRKQEIDLRNAQQRQLSAEKLEALGTLAAGAAHELATPLSTIAVVAGEVEVMIQKTDLGPGPQAQELVEDIRLIRSELNRCRKILDTMAVDSGQAIGELHRKIPLQQFWEEIVDGISHSERVEFAAFDQTQQAMLDIPVIGLTHAMRGLIQNGVDASSDQQSVKVNVKRPSKGDLVWTIVDRGSGMAPEVLDRINEPFFTTKDPGKGMGLGVFLAQNIIERVGGTIHFRSRIGEGTRVVVTLPVEAGKTEGTANSE